MEAPGLAGLGAFRGGVVVATDLLAGTGPKNRARAGLRVVQGRAERVQAWRWQRPRRMGCGLAGKFRQSSNGPGPPSSERAFPSTQPAICPSPAAAAFSAASNSSKTSFAPSLQIFFFLLPSHSIHTSRTSSSIPSPLNSSS